MPVQTSYSSSMQIGYEGGIASNHDLEAISAAVEATSIRFGCAVVRGSSDSQVVLPDDADLLGNGATSLLFRGITVREDIRQQKTSDLSAPLGSDKNYAEETETLTIATHGAIYVRPEVNVTQGDPVYFRHTQTGVSDLLGALRNDADTANAQLIENAYFETSASAGELAIVRLSVGR